MQDEKHTLGILRPAGGVTAERTMDCDIGTLIEAWASHKSFRPKDGSDKNGTDFHGQKRSNDTHASTTDPDSRLYRKAAGREAKLCYMGHATMENRNGYRWLFASI
jgi:hypothetical protein